MKWGSFLSYRVWLIHWLLLNLFLYMKTKLDLAFDRSVIPVIQYVHTHKGERLEPLNP